MSVSGTATTPPRSPPCGARRGWSTPGDVNEWGGHEPLWNDIACEVLDISTCSPAATDRSTRSRSARRRSLFATWTGWADYKPGGPTTTFCRSVRAVRYVSAWPSAPARRSGCGGRTIDTTEPGYEPGEGDTVTFGCIDAKGTPAGPRWSSVTRPRSGQARRLPTFRPHPGQRRVAVWRRALDVDSVTVLHHRVPAPRSPTNWTAPPIRVPGTSTATWPARWRSTPQRLDGLGRTAPPDATVGNIGGADVCPSGWEVRFGRDDFTTLAIVGRDGETPLTQINTEAFGLYGNEPWSRTDLLPVANFELSRIASRVLSARSPAVMPRIAAVTLDAATGDGDVVAVVAAASPFTPTRWRCRHRSPPTAAPCSTAPCWSSGSPHDLTGRRVDRPG